MDRQTVSQTLIKAFKQGDGQFVTHPVRYNSQSDRQTDGQSVIHSVRGLTVSSHREPFSFTTTPSVWRQRGDHPLSTGESGRHLGGQKDTARQPFIQSAVQPVGHPGRKADRPTVT